jgi:hypothetical protein
VKFTKSANPFDRDDVHTRAFSNMFAATRKSRALLPSIVESSRRKTTLSVLPDMERVEDRLYRSE